jgi:O-antigen ligase
LLACAAFPLRIRHGFWVFHSISILDLFLLLTPLWLLVVNWERPHRIAVGERTVFLVLGLPLLLATLSLVWSENTGQTLYYMVQTLLALAVYLLVVNLLQHLTPVVIMRCLALLLLSAVAVAGLAMAGIPAFAPDTYGLVKGSAPYLDFIVVFYTRLSHPFWGLSNAFAGVMVFFVPIFLGWGVVSNQRRYLAVAGILLVAICLTLSRGAMLAILGSLPVLLLFWPQGRRAAIGSTLFFLGFAILVLWWVALQNPLIGEHLLYRLSASTIEIRLQQYSRAVELIKDAPLLGYGAGVTQQHQDFLAGGVHNTYLQAILGLGIPLGLAFSCAFFLLAGMLLLRKGPFRATERTMTVAAGCGLLAELLVFLVEAQFEGVLLRILFYLGMGFVVALLQGLPPTPEGISYRDGRYPQC